MPSIDYAALARDAAKGGEPVPAAEYDAEVTSATYKVASSGNGMYNVGFTISSGAYRGRKVWTNLVLKLDSPGSVSFFFGKMTALGLDAAYFATPEGHDTDNVCAALLGRVARIKVKLGEPYQGRVRNEVDNISALGVAANTPDVQTITTGDVATLPAEAIASPPAAPGLPPGLS
jgi:hypothetical protein